MSASNMLPGSKAVLVLGDSGSGKSTAIRTLPPEETFIINVLGKALPFRGSNKLYTITSKENPEGNMMVSDSAERIVQIIKAISDRKTNIKYLVIDDCGYVMMNAFLRKAMQKGYDKFTELAQDYDSIIQAIKNTRHDLFVFMIMHIDIDSHGNTKPKTVGKMTDGIVCIEGHFTSVLHTLVRDGSYKFVTNNDGCHMSKTPMGAFEQLIDNDFLFVANVLKDYFEGEPTNESI